MKRMLPQFKRVYLRGQWRRAGRLVLTLALLLGIMGPQVWAQSEAPAIDEQSRSLVPNAQPAPWVGPILDPAAPSVTAASAATGQPGPQRLIIDSDFGVDDTVAVAALLSLQEGIAANPIPVEIQALVTVAGNTTVENATDNARLLLAQYGLNDDDVPVIVGAKKPQKRDLSSTGKLIHGPDGLWWLAQISAQQSLNAASVQDSDGGKKKERKAVDFYCKDVDLSGTTLLTLGPLTNVAEAIKKCPETFQDAEGLRMIVLGGVDMTDVETPIVGNITPVTEFNFWQDPEAAQSVFEFASPTDPGAAPALDIVLIPQNAFTQYVPTPGDIGALIFAPNAVAHWLTYPDYAAPYAGQPGPLLLYVGTQEANGVVPGIPDLVAAAYAVDPAVQASSPATPAVVTVFGDSKAGERVGGLSLVAQSVFVPALDPSTEQPLGVDVLLGTTEQVAQIYDDKTLSKLADDVFANGQPFAANFQLLEDFLFGSIAAPPNNAQVVAAVDPSLVSAFLLSTLTPPFPLPPATAAVANGGATTATEMNERVFLPLANLE